MSAAPPDPLYIIKDTSGLFDLVSVLYPDRFKESYRVNIHDLERIHPPESDDERAQRHERLAMEHWAEFMRLTGKEPERTAPTLTAEDLRELRRLTQRWWTGAITNREFEHFLLVFLDDAEGKLGRSGR